MTSDIAGEYVDSKVENHTKRKITLYWEKLKRPGAYYLILTRYREFINFTRIIEVVTSGNMEEQAEQE